MTDKSKATIEEALQAFIKTVNATGGVRKEYDDDRNDNYYPVADFEWLDLADAYFQACEALGQDPLITKDEDDDTPALPWIVTPDLSTKVLARFATQAEAEKFWEDISPEQMQAAHVETIDQPAAERDVQSHIKAICEEAGLGTMAEIIGIIQDRERVEDEEWLDITADDVTSWYDSFIAHAIDQIEDEMLGDPDDEEDDQDSPVFVAPAQQDEIVTATPILVTVKREDLEKARDFWAKVAKENTWYTEPFHVQFWVFEDGSIQDSVSFQGMQRDIFVLVQYDTESQFENETMEVRELNPKTEIEIQENQS